MTLLKVWTLFEATEKSLEFEIKRSAILQKIAQEELDIIQDQIDAKGKDANL